MTGEYDPIEFLERAVRTPSHEDVAATRELLVETIAARGIDVVVDDAGNTVATREGNTVGPHVLLNTHIDTVTPHVPFERIDPGEDGGSDLPDVPGAVLRGRGACDAKGPLAALLAAFFAVDPGDGRVTLAVTPDEETLSTGAAALDLADLAPDAAIVGEPTGLDVCNAARGRFQGTVRLEGTAAHAAEPDSGANAIRAVREVIDALDSFDDRPDAPPVHPSLGEPTLTPTTIEGGSAANQVPAVCKVVVDRRSVPPETADGYRSALEDHLRSHVPGNVTVSFALTDRKAPFLEAFATDPDEQLVGTLADAATTATAGIEVVPETGAPADARGGGAVRPFTAATEASYFAEHAPTVVFGPGVLADAEGAVAHSEREYVRVPEVVAAADAVERALQSLLGR